MKEENTIRWIRPRILITICLLCGLLICVYTIYLLITGNNKTIEINGPDIRIDELFVSAGEVYCIDDKATIYLVNPKSGLKEIAVLPTSHVFERDQILYYEKNHNIYSCDLQGNNIQLLYENTYKDSYTRLDHVSEDYILIQTGFKFNEKDMYSQFSFEAINIHTGEILILINRDKEGYSVVASDSNLIIYTGHGYGSQLLMCNLDTMVQTYLTTLNETDSLIYEGIILDDALYYIILEGNTGLWKINLSDKSTPEKINSWYENGFPDRLCGVGKSILISVCIPAHGKIYLYNPATDKAKQLTSETADIFRTWSLVSDDKYFYWLSVYSRLRWSKMKS